MQNIKKYKIYNKMKNLQYFAISLQYFAISLQYFAILCNTLFICPSMITITTLIFES